MKMCDVCIKGIQENELSDPKNINVMSDMREKAKRKVCKSAYDPIDRKPAFNPLSVLKRY